MFLEPEALAAIALILYVVYFYLRPRSRPLPAGHFDRPRRFLLTGCASGMGRRITGELLRRGHYVCATDIQHSALYQAAKEDGWQDSKSCLGHLEGHEDEAQILLRDMDVTKPDEWDRQIHSTIAHWGGVDVVINFAGVLIPAGALDVTQQQIDLHVDVMVKGVMHGTCAASKAFLTQPSPAHSGHGGHIINVSSLGAVAPVQGVSLYQASKAAARTFSIAASKDLAAKGIVVSVLMPDAVATPMAELQLLHDESTMAYSGGILTLDQLADCLLGDVLLSRPMEKRLGASRVRQWGAGFADNFPSSLSVALTEGRMRKKGRAAQARECERLLASGELLKSPEKRQAVEKRLEALQQPDATAAVGAGGRSGGRSDGRDGTRSFTWWLCRAGAFMLAWLALLHVGACAGPADLAAATLGLPLHPTAAGVALEAAGIPRGGQIGFRGRVALVTGATSGVGLETAGALAEAGFSVLLGARNAASAHEAAFAVQRRADRAGLGGSATPIFFDLSSLASVRAAAGALLSGKLLKAAGGLHVLVCSAGQMPSPVGGGYAETADGIESTWAVNHLGHFALAKALRPALSKAARSGFPARVVVVSSEHGRKKRLCRLHNLQPAAFTPVRPPLAQIATLHLAACPTRCRPLPTPGTRSRHTASQSSQTSSTRSRWGGGGEGSRREVASRRLLCTPASSPRRWGSCAPPPLPAPSPSRSTTSASGCGGTLSRGPLSSRSPRARRALCMRRSAPSSMVSRMATCATAVAQSRQHTRSTPPRRASCGGRVSASSPRARV